MIQDIGAEAGIYYTSEVLQLLYENTNGHPQITRWLCSMIAGQVKERPHMVEINEANSIINQFVEHQGSSLKGLFSFDPAVEAILSYLSEVREAETSELFNSLRQSFKGAADFQETLKRMEHYGLI